MSNQNHPEAGDIIKVDPIKDVKDIARIKKNLSGHARDYALFVMGINTNLRGSDLLSITVGMVRGLKAGESFQIREQKTSKVRDITIGKSVYEAIRDLLETQSPSDSDGMLLFRSRKASSKTKKKGESVERDNNAMTIQSLNRLVKKSWCHGLKGNYGAHTLRKTFGYQQHVNHGVSLPVLMEAFNHSSQKQTLAYIGISNETIQNIYLNEI